MAKVAKVCRLNKGCRPLTSLNSHSFNVCTVLTDEEGDTYCSDEVTTIMRKRPQYTYETSAALRGASAKGSWAVGTLFEDLWLTTGC